MKYTKTLSKSPMHKQPDMSQMKHEMTDTNQTHEDLI
jgi:hypothetical protein